MASDAEADDSESGLLSLALVVPVVLAWVGLPTVIFGALWLYALAIAENLGLITVPTVTIGLASALGAPATLNGVPTLIVAAAGIASTTVWFALFGGGSAPEKFRSRHREERRFEF